MIGFPLPDFDFDDLQTPTAEIVHCPTLAFRRASTTFRKFWTNAISQ
jgi:hypothetical protein